MGRVRSDLLDKAPCGFVSFADDGRILYANTTLLERLGYKLSDIADRHVEVLFGIGSRIFYQTHFFPLVKLHGRAQEIFLLLRGKDGQDVGMLCNAVRRERDGEDVTDCVFMEVQERRKFEEALLNARQEAERANRLLTEQRRAAEEANQAKSSFLAVMSHELRTPLNAIGGYVQLLEMEVHGPVTSAQREALGRINRSQLHLLRLINDVLNLSRIEAGRVDYRAERIELDEAVRGVLPMVEPQMRSKKLKFEAPVPGAQVAVADTEKVQQILLNLLTNAVKFTDTEGRIEVETGSSSRGRVFVRVTDTGRGIPPDMLEKVFEPFIQVDPSRSRAAEGTGLGLAISRDLARGMGGDLTATSTIGSGSTFELTLPSASSTANSR